MALQRLEARYGEAVWPGPRDPVDELVACILSQHTTDATAAAAFQSLRRRYPTWAQAAHAPTDAVADAIRVAGLARTRAPRIQAALRALEAPDGSIGLDELRGMSDGEARDRLMSLPGVGPKTAAIVLCFALGRPVMPVDTHVFRVSRRLGWVSDRSVARAHDALQALTPPDLVYRLHIALVRHGRDLCRARVPRCSACPLAAGCAHALQVQAARNRPHVCVY